MPIKTFTADAEMSGDSDFQESTFPTHSQDRDGAFSGGFLILDTHVYVINPKLDYKMASGF